MLKADKINLSASGRDTPILCDVSLSIAQGDFIVILGHNGSGKSSLVKVLSGDRTPTSGQIMLDGNELKMLSKLDKAREMITLTQKADERLFQDLTLKENIELWESRFEADERVGLKEILDLTGIGHRLSLKTDQLIKDFSGGEKQSILLGLALSHPPKILFLDEHTASLDYKAAKGVMERTSKAIKEFGITAIMITHSLEDALNYGNRLIIMNEGKVVVNEPKMADWNKEKLKGLMS